jgi:hypothetical protein
VVKIIFVYYFAVSFTPNKSEHFFANSGDYECATTLQEQKEGIFDIWG